VSTVRASISPDDVASRTLVEAHGFTVVGQQWDEEDGLQIVSEVAVGDGPAASA
jgi:ribosomal-protein-alanine N-acetyltransferase